MCMCLQLTCKGKTTESENHTVTKANMENKISKYLQQFIDWLILLVHFPKTIYFWVILSFQLFVDNVNICAFY